MLKTDRSERGQVLVLFVALFSVFLVLGAFAIDQGFWYGRRRIVQKDADLAARAGALAYIGDITGTGDAERRAGRAADDNGATGIAAAGATTSCMDAQGDVIAAPSIEVRLDTQARRLFSGLGLASGGGDDSPIKIRAMAVACVGSLDTLRVEDQGLSIVLNSGGPCFDGGTLRLGRECAIFRSGDRIFGDPRGEDCYGRKPDPDDAEDGVSFLCTTTIGGGCDDLHCLRTQRISDEDDHEDVLHAIEDRLDDNTHCDSLQEPNRDSFQNAFGYGDGDPRIAPDPPPLANESGEPAGPRDQVYVQNDCFDNPRVAVMPISGGNSERLPVRGFAVVYITGCYSDEIDPDTGVEIDPIIEPNPDGETNDCDGHGHGHGHGHCDDGHGEDDHHGRCCRRNDDDDEDCDEREIEVRGIPVHVFITEGSLGGIAAPGPNAPLTIQTVQ